MKRVQIYLTEKTKKIANEMQENNKVSLSTLCDIVIFEIGKEIKVNTATFEKIKTKYEIKNGMRTSIHLTRNNPIHDLFSAVELSKIITNCLFYFCEKKLDLIIDNPLNANKVRQKILNQLKAKYDIYWNLNAQIRVQKRAQALLNRGDKK